MLDAGGVHVVVNFVPTDMSELTQLQGRTARRAAKRGDGSGWPILQ